MPLDSNQFQQLHKIKPTTKILLIIIKAAAKNKIIIGSLDIHIGSVAH